MGFLRDRLPTGWITEDKEFQRDGLPKDWITRVRQLGISSIQVAVMEEYLFQSKEECKSHEVGCLRAGITIGWTTGNMEFQRVRLRIGLITEYMDFQRVGVG